MTVTELSGKQAAARRSRRISILGATGQWEPAPLISSVEIPMHLMSLS